MAPKSLNQGQQPFCAGHTLPHRIIPDHFKPCNMFTDPRFIDNNRSPAFATKPNKKRDAG
jgi:hypothetical protein